MLLTEHATPTKKRKDYEEEYTGIITPKRIKYQTTPVSSPQPVKLDHLTKDELLDLLNQLMEKHPSIEPTVQELAPKPSLQSTTDLFTRLEKKLIDSIPYSKVGPDRSDYAYNRVRPILEKISNDMYHYLDLFTLPQQLDEYPMLAFQFLHFCTLLAHRLPIWNSSDKNIESKMPLYEKLGRHYRICVNETGKRVSQGMFSLM
jgi:hypothetical protein